MRVELTGAVFTADAHAERLLLLLRHFREGRHEWSLTPLLVGTAETFVDRHVPMLAPTYKQLVRKTALRQAYSTPADPAPVCIRPDDIEDHVADLDRPAVVMVENDATDGEFIITVAKVFGADDIHRAIEKEWLVIDHGGGAGDTFRRAVDKRDRFRRLPRVAVVLDSDRLLPGTPSKHEADVERLRAKNIRVHVLHLREIENYIPDKCLRGLPSQQSDQARVNALAQLTKEQRGHYDMKKGFKNGKIPSGQKSLFKGLSPELCRDLAGGFGPKTIKGLLDHADRLTEGDFRTDVGPDVPDELHAMLAMVREIV